MNYKLMNFNISHDLKKILEELSLRKHVSQTAILNNLIATHGLHELKMLRTYSRDTAP